MNNKRYGFMPILEVTEQYRKEMAFVLDGLFNEVTYRRGSLNPIPNNYYFWGKHFILRGSLAGKHPLVYSAEMPMGDTYRGFYDLKGFNDMCLAINGENLKTTLRDDRGIWRFTQGRRSIVPRWFLLAGKCTAGAHKTLLWEYEHRP